MVTHLLVKPVTNLLIKLINLILKAMPLLELQTLMVGALIIKLFILLMNMVLELVHLRILIQAVMHPIPIVKVQR